MDEFIFCVQQQQQSNEKKSTPRHISLTISKNMEESACVCEELYLFYFLLPLPTEKIYVFIIRSIFPFNSFLSLPSLSSHPIYAGEAHAITIARRQHWIWIARNKWNKRNKQSKRTNGKNKSFRSFALVCAHTQHLVSLLDSFFENREVVSNICDRLFKWFRMFRTTTPATATATITTTTATANLTRKTAPTTASATMAAATEI